ncbi:MAG: ribokinase [Rhodobacteraceae bacterium]|nr:ribokinase [Paracoccaceae bacterium]
MSVVVIGNATLDLTYRVARFPDPGETFLCTERHIGPGGKGLNQAVAAARAGAQVVLHVPIGQDWLADHLRGALGAEDGLLLAAWIRPALATDESSIWVADTGENMIVSTADCATSVTPAEAIAALQGAGPGHVLAMQGNLTEATTVAALGAARAAGVTTVLNPAPVRCTLDPLLGKVDVLVVNRIEAQVLGIGIAPGELPQVAARLGGAVVVTLGGDTIRYARADGTFGEQPVRAVEPVDTTGAGDAFVGVLCAALDRGASLENAVARAADAGRQAVMTLGALAPAKAVKTVSNS